MAENNSNSEPVRISSIGVLDLKLQLTLNKSDITSHGLQVNDIKDLSDLAKIISIDNPNFLDQIVLSTSNSLINILLFINRSFKRKTFIEFIITSQIAYAQDTLFFKDIIKYVTDKNLLFIIDNKITNIPSSVTFTLRILDDDTNDFIMKTFSIGNSTVTIDNEIDSSNLFDKLAYKFPKDYFICSINDLLQLKQNNDDNGYMQISLFLRSLISKYPQIHIITHLSSKLITEDVDHELLQIIKDIIDYSDILLAEKDDLEKFYQMYNDQFNYNKKQHQPLSIKETIIQESHSKKRKDLTKITILIDKLENVSIYMQERVSMRIVYHSNTIINLYVQLSEMDQREARDTIVNGYYSQLKSVFIGGFLSRMLNGKTFAICLEAGEKSVKRVMRFIIDHMIDTITNNSLYEVIVHTKHNRSTNNHTNDFINQREKGFLLDCVNQEQSRLKDYNSIRDYSCQAFINSYSTRKFLKKQGFINKKGLMLKDPMLLREPFDKKEEVHRNTNNCFSITLQRKFGSTSSTPMSMTQTKMNQTWKETKKFTSNNTSVHKPNSPFRLPPMNKTQYFPKKKEEHGFKKSIHMKSHYLDKENLRQLLSKFEQKASTAINQYDHKDN